MSVQIGVKRLQKLVEAAWAMYPGGEIPQAGQAVYDWGRITAVRLFTSENLLIDAVVRGEEVHIEVHRRTASLAWGREVVDETDLWNTARAFQRAAYIKGLTDARR